MKMSIRSVEVLKVELDFNTDDSDAEWKATTLGMQSRDPKGRLLY